MSLRLRLNLVAVLAALLPLFAATFGITALDRLGRRARPLLTVQASPAEKARSLRPADRFRRSIARDRALLIAAAAAWIAGFLVVHRSLSGRVLGLLGDLDRGFKHLGRGEYNHRLVEAGPPEFRETARAFNRMAQVLGENSRRVIEASEEERRRLAEELHDESSQLLSALIIALDSLVVETGGAGEALGRDLGKIRHLAGKLLDSLHAVSRQLRPPLLDELGLGAALRYQVREFEHYYGVAADLSYGLRNRLRPEMEISLYRLVQEALTNVGRHARAKNVSVELYEEDDTLVLEIQDDGVGFDWRAAGEAEGLGLRHMRERAAFLHGELTFRSGPGGGTCLTLRFPRAALV